MKSTAGPAKRVGVIGAGEVVRSHHIPVLIASGVDVAWVADPASSAARISTRRFGVPALSIDDALDQLHNVDAVLLAAPVGRRDGHHKHLSRSGVAVYIEKPIARGVSELDHLIAAYGTSRVTCGFQRRSFANVAEVQRLISENSLGAVRKIELHEGGRTLATGTPSEFRDDVSVAGGGVLTDLGCHGLDTIGQLVDLTNAVVSDHVLIVDDLLDRDARVLMQAGDVDIEVVVSWLRDIEGRLKITFDNGTVTTAARMLGPVVVETSAGSRTSTPPVGSMNASQGFWNAWCHNLGLPGSGIDYSLPTARSVVRIIDDVYRAAGLR